MNTQSLVFGEKSGINVRNFFEPTLTFKCQTTAESWQIPDQENEGNQHENVISPKKRHSSFPD